MNKEFKISEARQQPNADGDSKVVAVSPFAKLLLSKMQELRIKKSELAKLVKVSNAAIYKWFIEDTPHIAKTNVAKLSKVLQVSIEDLELALRQSGSETYQNQLDFKTSNINLDDFPKTSAYTMPLSKDEGKLLFYWRKMSTKDKNAFMHLLMLATINM
jgi:hypothetical protein